MADQRRQDARFDATGPVYLRFRGDNRNVGGFLVNISRGGAYIRCSTPVEVGRELLCAFALGTSPFKCKGHVRWIPRSSETRRCLGPGFGVAFSKPEEEIDQLAR